MASIHNEKCNYITKNKIKIFFDGKPYDAYEGDTVASALLRNNIKLLDVALNITDQEVFILVVLKNQMLWYKY